MKWTLVRYRAKSDRADENQRLSAAVFDEIFRGVSGTGELTEDAGTVVLVNVFRGPRICATPKSAMAMTAIRAILIRVD